MFPQSIIYEFITLFLSFVSLVLFFFHFLKLFDSILFYKHLLIIFLIDSTDPSNDFFINLNNNDHISKIYIRADDNINFPGKLLIQKYMKIIYTPYTDNISSTMIRNNIFNS